MKKLTALAVLLTVIGTAALASSGPLGENSIFKIVPKANDKYELVYVSSDAGNVRISILDEEGKILESNTVKDVARFRRTFDFSQLAHGKYFIVVKNAEGASREEITYVAKQLKLQTFVTRIPDSKSLKLHVGDFNKDKPVYVRIYDQDNRVVHKETIANTAAFSNVYTLNEDQTGVFTLQVSNDGDFRSFTYELKE